MDAALRRNLGDALADKLDEEVIDDLLTGSRLGNNNSSTEDDFDSYRKRFLYDRIDGTWATEASDIRVLMGAASYGHAAAAYRAAANADNGLGALRAESGGVRVTAHAPAVTGNKQNCLVRAGESTRLRGWIVAGDYDSGRSVHPEQKRRNHLDRRHAVRSQAAAG